MMSFPQNQGRKIYTVSALTEEVKTLLEAHFEFVWVEGEISNLRMPTSGHYYMVLKDESAQLRAVMFRPQARYLKFAPEDGMKVIAQGRIGVYPLRGEYQIVLDYLEPLGVGALALAFEQLKRKLASQGVFDQDKKRPLPFLPQRVAVITSPTGAAIRDFLKVIQRRFANIEIIIIPVKVQGDEATGEMVEALQTVNRELDVDVIVLTRGGGSFEDLWAFNQEALALAIRASRIPVVSAVGHEIDWTISDLSADLRAPTPSSAAEIIVAEKESIRERLNTIKGRLRLRLITLHGNLYRHLDFLAKRLGDPRKRMSDSWMRLDEVGNRMIRSIHFIMKDNRKRLASGYRALLFCSPSNIFQSIAQRVAFHRRSLISSARRRVKDYRMAISFLGEKIKDRSPLSILERGYSITFTLPERRILRNAGEVRQGDHVNVLLAEGEMECLIEKIEAKAKIMGRRG